MDYNRLVAVTGLPGLYELVSSKTDGALVRSLEDQSTKFVSARVHNLSHLESIEVYTEGENVNLVDVFNAMKESKESLPDVKDNKAIKNYFEKVYPAMDFERVYASDMKKMIKWYEILNQNNVDIKLSEHTEEESTDQPVEETAEQTVTAVEVSGMDTAETAPKKTRRKKKTEE